MSTENTVLYLASASPRRRDILDMLGFEYTLLLPDADENSGITEAPLLVEELAGRKAMAACEMLSSSQKHNALVLAADTLVECGGEIMGKPKNKEDAVRMIKMLSGSTHHVYSGIALWHNNKLVTAHEGTEVRFAEMTQEEIEAYVACGESYDKAGAYAVQGLASMWIDGLNGCSFNVVGLPVRRMYALMQSIGISPLSLRRKSQNG